MGPVGDYRTGSNKYGLNRRWLLCLSQRLAGLLLNMSILKTIQPHLRTCLTMFYKSQFVLMSRASILVAQPYHSSLTEISIWLVLLANALHIDK